MASMMLIFFAVAATSCQKENDIAPTTPTVPAIPSTPVTPAVSLKPVSITTTQSGAVLRTQTYQYDTQGKLTKYESVGGGTSDSVLVRENNIIFKRPGSNNVLQSLVFNGDKTFKALFSATQQFDFANNQTQLRTFSSLGANNIPINRGEFVYTNNNLSRLSSEIRVDVNYFDNLPYQKGINEIPVALKPIQYYKIMEQENATTTVLYSKLIRQVILTFGGGRFETHDYSYSFDANNRVALITDTVTSVTASTSVQKVLRSTISY